jgi:hypothetical protein
MAAVRDMRTCYGRFGDGLLEAMRGSESVEARAAMFRLARVLNSIAREGDG